MRERIAARAAQLVAGRRVMATVSGGADSGVAAWALRGLTNRAIHIHHGYEASDHLAEAARAIADALGLELTVVRVVPRGRSESAAREARWRAIFEMIDDETVVATGHTRDDQAETVLHNLLRGSGPEGLAAMRNTDRIVRPLLDETREEVRALARSLELPFFDDPTNASREHRRNRIRHELIPMLEAGYNPALRESLARTAAHLAQVPQRSAPFTHRDGVARIPVALLRTAEPMVAASTIREAVRTIRPPYPPTAAEVDRVIAVVAGTTGRAEVGGGVVCLRDRSSLRLGPIPDALTPVRLEAPVTRVGGFRLGVRDAYRRPLLSPERTHLRADVEWWARAPEATDRIALPSGHKSVWDALAEAGVPAELRPAWPVVADGDSVAWIPLVRRAAAARPDGVGYLEVDTYEELW